MRRKERNNPGNLITNQKDLWYGEKIQDKSRFCTFSHNVYGIRALYRNIISYIQRDGVNTPEKIVTRWAPPEDNETIIYLSNVCQWAEFSPDTVIFFGDYNMLKLGLGIMRQEGNLFNQKVFAILDGFTLATTTQLFTLATLPGDLSPKQVKRSKKNV